MLRTNTVDVASKIRLGYCRKQRHAVLLAFTVPNHDLVQSEVGVLDAQSGAFEEPQAGAVEQHRHQPRCPLQFGEHPRHLVAAHHHRKASRHAGANDVLDPGKVAPQNLAVEEHERAERLVLCRCAHPRVDRERRKKGSDLLFSHLGWMPLLVEQDESPNPADVTLLGLAAVMTGANLHAHPIEQPWFLRTGWRGLAHDEQGEGAAIRIRLVPLVDAHGLTPV